MLVAYLPAPAVISAGSLGEMSLDEGHYLYCGSAQAGLMPRLARHMRVEKKKHWHIDSLTCRAVVIGALTFAGAKDTECLLAATVASVPGIEPIGDGFGSSDCGCPTHLFRLRNDVPLSVVLDVIRSSFSKARLNGQSI